VALSPVVGGWLYFGYRRISCHPMFASGDDACGAVSTMAAQHATAAGQLVLPYQEMLTEKWVEVVIVGIAALLWAITVEMVERFGLRRRAGGRKGQTPCGGGPDRTGCMNPSSPRAMCCIKAT
ncbi:hypothetical protein, partial [Rhodosalinus sediminis]|uniref:hypothetical protein n=1 Tax=Rhodosalinus sediminis TaxID=1940533 RepID=UPI00131471A9